MSTTNYKLDICDSKSKAPTDSFINNPLPYVSWIPKLQDNGANFLEWMRELDMFLMFIFDLSNFTQSYLEITLTAQENRAVQYLIQKSIDPQLLPLIEAKELAKDSIFTLQLHFQYSVRNNQLQLFLELMKAHHKAQSKDASASPIPSFFSLFNQLREVGFNIPQELQSIFIQTAIPPPRSLSQEEWFSLITSKLASSDSSGPKDVHRVIYKLLDSMDNEEFKSKKKDNDTINQKTHSLLQLFSNIQITRYPTASEINQAKLNIMYGNKQPGTPEQEEYGIRCHYCKGEGHWKSTCPIIRELEGLKKAPSPI
ncbi:hypothetical protein O181_048629 [Austropuccinia psidii MF-1]|uniref:CCHC-type domain-containing protein n=1 Tax=Austropuccinia psidii MF-1 TaxID=1389203 RepID=A0A9Q3HN37_9BASI|nr:hypothetical protein [Austropuccinia psidii MF-1]